MDLGESIRVAVEGIWANKLRAVLTMLGIVIGIAAVIAVVAIGQGGKAAINREMEKSGSNLFILYVRSVGTESIAPNERLTLQDATALQNALSTIKLIAPSSVEYADAESNERKTEAVVVGTTPPFVTLHNRTVSPGQFFSTDDIEGRRRVAVIDAGLANALFGGINPLGNQILINNTPVRVIGVIQREKSVFAQFNVGPQRNYMYIPWTTWSDIFATQRIDQLEASAISKDTVQPTIDKAKAILNRRHSTVDRYEAFNVAQMVSAADKIASILTYIVGAVAGISLGVGGIGIMNIMLVSVTERTREIGIRKALGAQRRDILMQFLIEAVVLSLAGGVIGMLVGIGGAFLASYLLNWPPLISWTTILIAVLFSAAVGIFFGIYPANKAARLDPIEALRYE
ncbi:MAG: ABC transporter permease [Peptococcaceae bacterium]|nr:ABC transporter permease [Peptococcaceae bacterium]